MEYMQHARMVVYPLGMLNSEHEQAYKEKQLVNSLMQKVSEHTELEVVKDPIRGEDIMFAHVAIMPPSEYLRLLEIERKYSGLRINEVTDRWR